MDAIKLELIAYLTDQRNTAIVNGKMSKAQWLTRWLCALRNMGATYADKHALAYWYCELHSTSTQQLSLF